MTARLLDGRAVSSRLLGHLSSRVQDLHARKIHPKLSFVMIGNDASAALYAKRIQRLADTVGVSVDGIQLPSDVQAPSLEDTVRTLDVDPTVDGILVQMPLPSHLLETNLSDLISPRKDVDGITVHNVGNLYLGRPGQRPSTAVAMMEILRWADVCVTGMNVTVVGRSNVIGHPVTELLLQQDATVTVTHRKTRDLGMFTRLAEVLIVAAGEPFLIRGDMISPGAIVLDAGINVTEQGLVGDVHFTEVQKVARAITPVPGGVGPVTNAVLLRSVVSSAEARSGTYAGKSTH